MPAARKRARPTKEREHIPAGIAFLSEGARRRLPSDVVEFYEAAIHQMQTRYHRVLVGIGRGGLKKRQYHHQCGVLEGLVMASTILCLVLRDKDPEKDETWTTPSSPPPK